MFLKFFIYKIEGDSMSPSLNNNTFVLIKPLKKNIGKVTTLAQELFLRVEEEQELLKR